MDALRRSIEEAREKGDMRAEAQARCALALQVHRDMLDAAGRNPSQGTILFGGMNASDRQSLDLMASELVQAIDLAGRAEDIGLELEYRYRLAACYQSMREFKKGLEQADSLIRLCSPDTALGADDKRYWEIVGHCVLATLLDDTQDFKTAFSESETSVQLARGLSSVRPYHPGGAAGSVMHLIQWSETLLAHAHIKKGRIEDYKAAKRLLESVLIEKQNAGHSEVSTRTNLCATCINLALTVGIDSFDDPNVTAQAAKFRCDNKAYHIEQAWGSILDEAGNLRKEVKIDMESEAFASMHAANMLQRFSEDIALNGTSFQRNETEDMLADRAFIKERVTFFYDNAITLFTKTNNKNVLGRVYKSFAFFKASIDLKDEATCLLRESLDLTVELADAQCAQCHQSRNKQDAEMLVCGSCRVARYCSVEHQRLHWTTGAGLTSIACLNGEFLAHKDECPLLQLRKSIRKGRASLSDVHKEQELLSQALGLTEGRSATAKNVSEIARNLMYGIKEGNLNKVKTCLKGQNLMKLEQRSKKYVGLVLRDKSDGSVKGSDRTMLMLAVSMHSKEGGSCDVPGIVRELCSNVLQNGSQTYIMKACTEEQKTALHYAVANCHEDAALILLEVGGEELGLKQDRQGRTCLHLAAELPNASKRLISSLVERGGGKKLLMAASIKEEGELTCMHYAAQDGRLHSLIALCELGGKELWLKANLGGQTPLMTACAFGHLELVKELLKRGGSELWMKKDETPAATNCLHLAIQLKQVEVVKLLCERAPDLMLTRCNESACEGERLPSGDTTLTMAVILACKEIKALEFTELCTGAAVKIHSLKSAPECNGLFGVVQAFDSVKGRWTVKISASLASMVAGAQERTLSLQPCNITLLSNQQAVDKRSGGLVCCECGAASQKLLACSKCKRVYYCSKTCQVFHIAAMRTCTSIHAHTRAYHTARACVCARALFVSLSPSVPVSLSNGNANLLQTLLSVTPTDISLPPVPACILQKAAWKQHKPLCGGSGNMPSHSVVDLKKLL